MILHQNIFVSNSNLIFNLNSISKLILIILLKFCVTIDGAVNESISSSHSLIGNQQNHIFVSSNNWSQQNEFCGPPPKIDHAHCNLLINQKHGMFKVGEIASYVCEHGYRKTSGQDQLKCLAKDEMHPTRWDGEAIKCEIVTCTDPGDVDNATRKIGNFTYNTNVEYKCMTGFRMIGVPFLTCKETGQWNRDKPFCQLQQCPELGQIENGNISYSDPMRRTDSKAEYICNFGYKFNYAHNIKYCKQDDSWSELVDLLPLNPNEKKKEPKCQLISCDMPARPHAGLTIVTGKQQVKSVFRPGDIIIYSCRQTGVKAAVKCLPDGTWHRGAPHCPFPNEVSCPAPKVENGRIEGSKPFQVYSSIKFKCDQNYVLEGSSKLFCLPNGKWNDTIPKCASTSPIIESQSSSSKLTILIICIIIIILIIILISLMLLLRWRKQQLERKRWQRYFGNYNHRQSKTNFTYNNSNEMKCFRQSPKPTVPSTDL